MYTEELGLRIAVANARAKELEDLRITYNLQTGKEYSKRPNNPNKEMRYYVDDREFAYVKEIQEAMKLRTHHDVHFRLASKHKKWSSWGYIRDRKS